MEEMKEPPKSRPPRPGENPFEDSEAQLDSIMGDMEHAEPLLDPGDTRRLPQGHHLKANIKNASTILGESSFLNDLQAAHEAPMYSPGTMINERFQLVKQLGAGGMGAVYLANDLRLNDQKALKTMLPGLLASKEAQNRFILEIKALQRLAHPGIIRVFDYGRDSRTGSCFFSMEYVEGTTLSELLIRRGGRLTVEETVDIILQLLDVLSYAHTSLVHRDLKPLNIMLRPNGRILVLDFGLAKMMSPGQLTQSSMVLGTVYYQSPEQSIRPGEVDKRSDLYSVGVIIYQLLTGEVPVGHIHPPSKLNKAVSRALDRVIMRCLESQREDRYQTAEELAAALRQATRPRKKHAAWTTVVLLLLLVLLAGVSFYPPARETLQKQWATWMVLSDSPPELPTLVVPDDEGPPVVTVDPSTPNQAERDQLRFATQEAWEAFEAESSPIQWAPEAHKSAVDGWNAFKNLDEATPLSQWQIAADTVLQSIEESRQLATAAQFTWEQALNDAQVSAEQAEDSAREALGEAEAPESLIAAQKQLENARLLREDAAWARAENGFLEAKSLYDEFTKGRKAAGAMNDRLEGLKVRDKEVMALQEKAKGSQATQYATARYESALESLAAARNAVKNEDFSGADTAYDEAASTFRQAHEEARNALDTAARVAREALARREASAMKKEGSPVTSGTVPTMERPVEVLPVVGLTVEPTTVVFRSLDDVATVAVKRNGKPATSDVVKGYRFVDHGTVAPMFIIEGLSAPAGTVRISPVADKIQPGDYVLQIVGQAETIELRLSFQMGATPPNPTITTGSNVIERIEIDFSSNFTTGQYIQIPLQTQAGRRFVWKRDGKIVQEGIGKATLALVAEKAGTFSLSLEEFSGDQLKAAWNGTYTVADEAPVPVETTVNTAVRFSTSENFGAFNTIEWSINGTIVGRLPEFSHAFDKSGTYEILCHGKDPKSQEGQAFRKLRYQISVR